MNKTPYTDVILNAFESIQAWRAVSLALMVALLVESVVLGWLVSHRTVLLVPQHVVNQRGPIEVNLGDPFSPDYLTGVAKGDVYPLLNWTPENLDTQYAQFLARLVPALHDAQRESLLSESKQHLADGLTQSFYITRTFVRGATVELHGILVRSTGGKEVFRGNAVYALEYTNVGNGLLQVSGVSQPGAPVVVSAK